METPIEKSYEDTIYPCAVRADGTWITSRDDRVSLINQPFNTPAGIEWDSEPVRFISVAHNHIDECAECGAEVPEGAPMLEAVVHRIYPCCACNVFVWLERPPFPDDFAGDWE